MKVTKLQSIPSFLQPLVLLAFVFLVTSEVHSEPGPQDNWYLLHEWSGVNSSPHGVAVGPDGLIYVAEQDKGNRVSVWNTDGTFIKEFKDNNMKKPWDVAFDEEGNMYVLEVYRVRAYDKDGTLLWLTGKNASTGSGVGGVGNGEFIINRGGGITVSPAGEVFVADGQPNDNHRIQVLDKDGNFLRKFIVEDRLISQENIPYDVGFNASGELLVGMRDFLYYYKPDGEFIRGINGAKKYFSVSLDGTLFSNGGFRDENGVLIYSTTPFASVQGFSLYTRW